jgi:hypothetical protein
VDRQISEELPESGSGVVVWPEETHPQYRITTLEAYRILQKPGRTYPVIAQADLDAAIARAVAETPPEIPIYVVKARES